MTDSPGPHVGFPPRLLYLPLLEAALREDLGGAGDITTDSVAMPGDTLSARIVSRATGCVAGLPLLGPTFQLLDGSVTVEALCSDGDRVEQGSVLALLSGSARAILTGERTALNFLGRLSGVATATRRLADLLDGSGLQVACTRKTTPGLRALEKYAVRAGGGTNHRFGLDDAVLLKDNHIALAGGVQEAVRRVSGRAGHMVKIEVEVDTLEQLRAVVDEPIDAVLLDNMSTDEIAEAVALVDGRLLIEVSGGITESNIALLASSGINLISVGALTHSAPALDVSLEVD